MLSIIVSSCFSQDLLNKIFQLNIWANFRLYSKLIRGTVCEEFDSFAYKFRSVAKTFVVVSDYNKGKVKVYKK